MTTATIPVERAGRPPRQLSARQYAALKCIAERAREGLPPPSFGEVAAAMGLASMGIVSYHLRRLADRGLITLGGRHVPRSIGVTAKARAECPELFPPTPAELVMAAVCDARAEGASLPAGVLAVLEAVA